MLHYPYISFLISIFGEDFFTFGRLFSSVAKWYFYLLLSIIGEYIICSETDGEDESCSNDYWDTSIEDHLEYFDIHVGQLSAEGCDNPAEKNDDL